MIAPERLALDLRKDLEITERYVNLEELLQNLDIEVRYESIVTGAEGLSRKLSGQDFIFIDPNIRSNERRRFTLAHELGHHLLGHVGQPCTSESIHGSP